VVIDSVEPTTPRGLVPRLREQLHPTEPTRARELYSLNEPLQRTRGSSLRLTLVAVWRHTGSVESDPVSAVVRR
jgi:hypothetical protein